MRLLLFFDLPTHTKKQKKAYTRFRKFIINHGFIMLQFSVYVRICKGVETTQKYERLIEQNLPDRGNVRTLIVHNSQYEKMNIMLGNEKIEEKIGSQQLMFF